MKSARPPGVYRFALVVVFLGGTALAAPESPSLHYHAGGRVWPLEIATGYLAALASDGRVLPAELLVHLPEGDLRLENPVQIGTPGWGVELYEARAAADPATSRALIDGARALSRRPGFGFASPVLLLGGSLRIPTPRIVAAFPPGTPASRVAEEGASRGLAARPLYPDQDTWILEAPPGAPLDGIALLEAANSLVEQGTTLWATPDFLRRPVPRATVDDPLFVREWHLDDTPGDVDVNAPEGWDATKGDPETIIAVLDMGVDLGHPDLGPAIWTNPGEIEGNGIDDDGNGYVDDVHGWNFNTDSNDVSPCDPHGTGCAGVAAARGDNATGVAGVCPLCTILPIVLVCDWTTGTQEAAAFRYAADMGAAIESNSWGPDDFGCPAPCPQPIDPLSAQAIDYAVEKGRGGRGTAFFWASGNGATTPQTADDDGYASYPRVIAVGAVTNDGSRSWYSEGGKTLDLCAPSDGGTKAIFTTYPPDTWLEWFGGTSAAAPAAAGVGALALSWMPALHPDKLQDLLQQTAKKIGPPGDYDANGHSVRFGFGLVRAGGTGGQGVLSRIAAGVVLDRARYGCTGFSAVASVRDASSPGTVTVHMATNTEGAGEDVPCPPAAGKPGLFECDPLPLTLDPPAGGDGRLSISDGDAIVATYAGTPPGMDVAVIDCDPTGCLTPPTFSGLAAASDRNPCLADGIELQWSEPASWGKGGPGVYNIYRSETAPFAPGDSNRLASVAATAWTDATALPGVPYHYVVRAENGLAGCSGPHGGVEDGNATTLSATDGWRNGPVFAGIASANDLSACEPSGVGLYWDPPSSWGDGNPAFFHIYRSDVPGFQPGAANRIASLPPSELLWEDVPPAGGVDHFYIVRAENDLQGCGGPNGGAEDTNLIQASARDSALAPPVFGGLQSAVDADPCSTSEILLAWNPVTDWGAGGAGWFDIYRSQSIPLVPGPVTYQDSVPGTESGWTDAGVVPGIPYYYLVRAENSASGCSGPNGGRQEQNVLVLAASDQVGVTPPSPNLLFLSPGPMGGAHLDWVPVNGASYNVYRGTLPTAPPFVYNHACLAAGLPTPGMNDAGTPAPDRGFYYLVSSRNNCGEDTAGTDSEGNPIPLSDPCP